MLTSRTLGVGGSASTSLLCLHPSAPIWAECTCHAWGCMSSQVPSAIYTAVWSSQCGALDASGQGVHISSLCPVHALTCLSTHHWSGEQVQTGPRGRMGPITMRPWSEECPAQAQPGPCPASCEARTRTWRAWWAGTGGGEPPGGTGPLGETPGSLRQARPSPLGSLLPRWVPACGTAPPRARARDPKPAGALFEALARPGACVSCRLQQQWDAVPCSGISMEALEQVPSCQCPHGACTDALLNICCRQELRFKPGWMHRMC